MIALMAGGVFVYQAVATTTGVTIDSPIAATPTYKQAGADVAVQFDVTTDAAGDGTLMVEIYQGSTVIGTTGTYAYTFLDGANNDIVANVTLGMGSAEGNYTVKVTAKQPAGGAQQIDTEVDAVVVDNSLPTLNSVVLADSALKAGETSLVTFTFSEAVTGFDENDVTVGSGTIGAVTVTGNPLVYTGTLTPSAATTDAENVVSVGLIWSDLAANAPISTPTSANYAVDTVRPTVAVTLDDSSLVVGQTAAVTFTFSEVPSEFDSTDVTVGDGSIGAVSATGNPLVFTATLTPTADFQDNVNLVTVGIAWTDPSGNMPSGPTNSANYTIDTLRPTVGAVFTDTALKIGDTSVVTFTFNEVVTGFTNNDLTIVNGALTDVESADGGTTWTGTFTPTADIESATNAIIVDKSGVTDAAGNIGTGATSSNNYAIDTLRPTVVSVVLTDTALKALETSTTTITFSEAVTDFDNTDITTIENGTLSPVASADGGITWTSTFTPSEDIADTTNIITVTKTGINDAAGNAGEGTTSSANYAVDTVRPTVAAVLTDTALTFGETTVVTFTFSEVPSGFDETDVTVANGAIGAVSATGDPLVFTATLTPATDTEDTSNVLTVGFAWVDPSGNMPTGATNSANYTIDTLKPSVVITDNEAGTANIAGGDITYTFTFSEAVTGFTVGEVTVAGGTKAADFATGVDGDTVYTLVVTPAASSVVDITVDVAADVAQDASLNNNTAATQSVQAVDTLAPTVVITDDEAGTANIPGGTVTYTFTFSEAVTGFAVGDVTVANGTKAADFATGVGGDTVYTLAVTPDADSTTSITVDVAGSVAIDANSNDNTAAVQSVQAVDTLAPTVTNVTASTDNGTYNTGDTVNVTVTFSQAVTVVGTPQILLETGATDRQVDYASGSGGATLTFTYTVASGDVSSDLDYNSNAALTLNSGTINDANGNPAVLTLAEPAAAGSLGDNKALVIDGAAPVVNAGSDAGAVTAQFTQNATVTDAGTGVATYAWTKLSGPYAVTFGTASAEDSTVAAAGPGYYVIRLTVTDNAGNVTTDDAAFTWGTTGVPILAYSPNNSATNVAITNGTATITFNTNITLLDATKVTLVDDLTSVSKKGTVAVSGGDGTSAILNIPYTGLANSKTYRINILAGAVRDASGNVNSDGISYFTTVAGGTGTFGIISTTMTKLTGTADNTYGNGWEWVIRMTLPTDQNSFALKFNDWVSGANTLATANNMQYYSEQIAAGTGSSGSPITITAANTYPSNVTVSTDADATTAGIQTDIHVKVKIPASTASGSYSTSYRVNYE